MPNLSRRAAIAATLPVTLAACGLVAPTSAGNVAQDLAALQSDASTVVAGLQGILPQIADLGAQYAGAIAQVQKYLASAASYLPILSSFSNIADAQGTAQLITTAIADTLKMASQLPIPQPFSGVITAASVLLPVILSEAGLPAPAQLAPHVAGMGVTLTPEQARSNLKLSALGKL